MDPELGAENARGAPVFLLCSAVFFPIFCRLAYRCVMSGCHALSFNSMDHHRDLVERCNVSIGDELSVKYIVNISSFQHKKNIKKLAMVQPTGSIIWEVGGMTPTPKPPTSQMILPVVQPWNGV